MNKQQFKDLIENLEKINSNLEYMNEQLKEIKRMIVN